VRSDSIGYVPHVSPLAIISRAFSAIGSNRIVLQTFHVWLPSSPPLHGELEIDITTRRFNSGYHLSRLQRDWFQSDRVPDVPRLATFFTAASRRFEIDITDQNVPRRGAFLAVPSRLGSNLGVAVPDRNRLVGAAERRQRR